MRNSPEATLDLPCFMPQSLSSELCLLIHRPRFSTYSYFPLRFAPSTSRSRSSLPSPLQQCINSVSRKRLNEYLLTRAETLPNVTLHFEHPLADVDLDKARLSFRREGKEWHFDADLVVGADGAFSRVRRVLMRKIHMKYEQEYLDHGYVELNIEPKEGGGWKMDPNHLHIWPKHSYMMIALPNPVGVNSGRLLERTDLTLIRSTLTGPHIYGHPLHALAQIRNH